MVEGEDAEKTKTVNQAAAELEAEIGAQYPTHPGMNASDPVFQAQLAAATSPADDRRAARPDPRYVAAGTAGRGLDDAVVGLVRLEIAVAARSLCLGQPQELKEAPRTRALRNRIDRRYARPALEKIKSESIDRVSYPGGLEAFEDQPYRH